MPKDVTERMVIAHKHGQMIFEGQCGGYVPDPLPVPLEETAAAVYADVDERIAFIAGYFGAKKRHAGLASTVLVADDIANESKGL